MKIITDEVREWFDIIQGHLEAAEKAFESKNYDLAEAAVFEARSKLRCLKSAVTRQARNKRESPS